MSLCNKNCFCVTKYRRDGFTKERLDDLRPVLASVCTDFESELIDLEEEDDHIRLLVTYPPKVAVSKPVNSLKAISSLIIRKKNDPNIRKKPRDGALWSPSYFSGSCGGAPLFASILSNGKRHAKLKAKEWKASPSALTSPP